MAFMYLVKNKNIPNYSKSPSSPQFVYASLPLFRYTHNEQNIKYRKELLNFVNFILDFKLKWNNEGLE